MKKHLLLALLFIWSGLAFAQKGEYKDSQLKLDGKVIAKVEKTKDKENLGLTSTFEVFSMNGEKLLIAAYAGEYNADVNNTLDQYYRFTFLPTDQVGIFAISKLNAEKSIGKLLASSGIIMDDKLDAGKVKEFIAKKGKSPEVAIDYTVVPRMSGWPIKLESDKSITQQQKVIGSFKDVTKPNSGHDSYEFRLPTGVVVAEVSFSDGNNAQECMMYTFRDTQKRSIKIPTHLKTTFINTDVDRNLLALRRVTDWLVSNGYL